MSRTSPVELQTNMPASLARFGAEGDCPVARSGASSAVRDIVDRGHADERDPELEEMLQETVELRLIADGTHKDRVAVLVNDAHARK
jgi:hypothetical protein